MKRWHPGCSSLTSKHRNIENAISKEEIKTGKGGRGKRVLQKGISGDLGYNFKYIFSIKIVS